MRMCTDKIRQFLDRMAAPLLMTVTLMLCACQFSDGLEDCDDGQQNTEIKKYINLTVTVSAGNTVTRAGNQPAGGEDGDGREHGLERESSVSGITLILYKDDAGINTANDPVIDFVAYYTTKSATPNVVDGKDIEAAYTTGDRLINSDDFDIANTVYHAIVVANKDLTGVVKKGEKLSKVRDMIIRENLYSGSYNNATDFIMSSGNDVTIDPAAALLDKTDPHKHYYRYTNIVIERLAARIDFWAAGSEGYKTSTENKAYTTPGYEYQVYDGETATADRFVVTGITPFNLNSYGNKTATAAEGGKIENYGGEYLIKRVADEVKKDFTPKYLGDETGANYVIDPATLIKSGGNLTYFKNQLSGIVGNTTHSGVTGFYRGMATLHGNIDTAGKEGFEDNGMTGDNLIIGYPMENTLWNKSQLYYFATGLAIEGDYYENGSGTPKHRIYYGYLRHNGTSESAYPAMLKDDKLLENETATSENAMEYGIVRNNIYRVYISKINKEADGTPKITLNIKVKKWDVFTHKTIYM